MDVLNKIERKLQILFLHFVHLSKINRERQYVLRNGKMPLFEERDKKYSCVYGLALRKFLEGISGSKKSYKSLTVTRTKGLFEYFVTLKEKYIYGSSQLLDNILKNGILKNLNVINNPERYHFKNHVITSEVLLFRDQSPRRRWSGRSSTNLIGYKYDFDPWKSDQAFASDFFDNYIDVLDQQNSSGLGVSIIEKKALARALEKTLLSMKDNKIFNSIEINKDSRLEKKKIKSLSINDIRRIGIKYSVTDETVELFITEFRKMLDASVGLQPNAVFNYVKSYFHTLSGENISRFDLNDFINLNQFLDINRF